MGVILKFVIVIVAAMGLSACTTMNKGKDEKNKTITKENNKLAKFIEYRIFVIIIPFFL